MKNQDKAEFVYLLHEKKTHFIKGVFLEKVNAEEAAVQEIGKCLIVKAKVNDYYYGSERYC